MNCNCVTEYENKIKELFKDEHDVEPTDVTCKNAGFRFAGGNLVTTLSIIFNVEADVKGFRSKNGKAVPVIANYCPFCGVSTNPKE